MDSSTDSPRSLPCGLTLCDDGLVRPSWASHDALLRSYYDTEWGMPVHDEADVERLTRDPGIIRNRRKIEAAISNARATLALRSCEDEGRGAATHLGDLVWSYRPEADPRPSCASEVPSQIPESVALAAALRQRGFHFVGPTTMLALMSAIGIVNTDIVGTHRRPR